MRGKNKSKDPYLQAPVDDPVENPAADKEAPDGLHLWTKPNGNTIALNENPATVAYAEKMGWER